MARKLGGWPLSGIAVGLVISGEYFGWSYGGVAAGTLGFLCTSRFVARMHAAFIFRFTELTTAIPHPGSTGDWSRLADINDPLPQAMKMIVGKHSGWLHMLVWLGLFGLVASFHGIIIGYSRQIFALARAGHLPKWLPALALICAMVCLLAMAYNNQLLAAVFAVTLLLGFAYFLLTGKQRAAADGDAMLEGPADAAAAPASQSARAPT
ncbi:hypothetical protein [Chromobacterium sphagni]|uniref:hypothetical protein n=1 Tax=Chromobacterium sphagni TaxID=1903179 RepID=UPI000BA30A3E|nr:hypothetical protein [Chromobacterium sphagni]